MRMKEQIPGEALSQSQTGGDLSNMTQVQPIQPLVGQERKGLKTLQLAPANATGRDRHLGSFGKNKPKPLSSSSLTVLELMRICKLMSYYSYLNSIWCFSLKGAFHIHLNNG
jgi:hypothetical protein